MPKRLKYSVKVHTREMRLAAIAKTVEDARYDTRKARHSFIFATDIRAAILEYQISSDEAMQNTFRPNTGCLERVAKVPF